MATANLVRYRRPRATIQEPSESVSQFATVTVCIPARNEVANIEECVRSVLSSRGIDLEVIVHDDQSVDGTGAIVDRIALEDPRVRRLECEPLPPGWNGKQWGCDRMGRAAIGKWVLFTDADVRLSPECVRLTLETAIHAKCDLISTIPRQITGTCMEDAVIPLIHFMLLSYLPMGSMRKTTTPAASAGCGQFLFVSKDAWEKSGGHESFRSSMHDGIQLPRSIRRAGGRTDLFDGTELVSCRMYRSFSQVWQGFAKNAFEGLGSIALLIFITFIHLTGHVLPWVWLLIAWPLDQLWTLPSLLAVVAIGIAIGERVALARRFHQRPRSVVLHPIGILLMTAIQWHSLWITMAGRRHGRAWRQLARGCDVPQHRP